MTQNTYYLGEYLAQYFNICLFHIFFYIIDIHAKLVLV